VLAGAATVAPLAAQQPAPVDTAAIARQTELGRQWFRSVCTECHANNLSDPDFRAKWSGRSVFDLYDIMRNTMPDSDPGSLTDETYAALTAYLLRMNGTPADKVVTTDSATLANHKLAFPSSTR